MTVADTTAKTGGVLAATCISTLVVNANTSAVSILLPAISADTGMSVDRVLAGWCGGHHHLGFAR
jgi:hypothetical protein